jgi:hypothetical protein
MPVFISSFRVKDRVSHPFKVFISHILKCFRSRVFGVWPQYSRKLYRKVISLAAETSSRRLDGSDLAVLIAIVGRNCASRIWYVGWWWPTLFFSLQRYNVQQHFISMGAPPLCIWIAFPSRARTQPKRDPCVVLPNAGRLARCEALSRLNNLIRNEPRGKSKAPEVSVNYVINCRISVQVCYGFSPAPFPSSSFSCVVSGWGSDDLRIEGSKEGRKEAERWTNGRNAEALIWSLHRLVICHLSWATRPWHALCRGVKLHHTRVYAAASWLVGRRASLNYA